MTDKFDRESRLIRHEALWPSDLFATGIGWVIVARFKSKGRRVETGVFLVDVFCLGVKFAVYEDSELEDYRRRIRDHYTSEFAMVGIDPCCARKLVEQAGNYARDLGFAPHPDYKKAARVFGGLRARECTEEFTFGHKGKPLYCHGPRETTEQAGRIVRHLEQRCGAGNYDYVVTLGGAD